jgi:hypothetical protein
MTVKPKDYSQYADHPRYGRLPNVTGLNPQPGDPAVQLHWNTRMLQVEQRAIPGTAVEADPSKQLRATVPVTHYYDLDTICRDCSRHFIFFAQEQKFWYEELQLPLEADAVRCFDCRRHLRAIADQKQRYECLSHVQPRTVEQNLEMADCCLSLVEQGEFAPSQTQHIRQLLNLIPEDQRSSPEYAELRTRLHHVENNTPSSSTN